MGWVGEKKEQRIEKKKQVVWKNKQNRKDRKVLWSEHILGAKHKEKY